jgi:Ser-tRNA(Ala) deacylase AlaX
LTELVFRDDPYLAACEARVVSVQGEGRVRLLEIQGVDLQACGGTHVRNTGEIGSMAVGRIRSEGKRNKRVTRVLS